MPCLLRFACLSLLLLGACSAPPPAEAPPATPAEALVRLDAQAQQLRPLLTVAQGPPMMEFELMPAATTPTDASVLAEAEKLLAEAPQMLNRTAEVLMPGGSLPEATRRDLIHRLRQQLRQTPRLDLGWAWLATLQAADRQLPPDTAIASLSQAIACNQQIGLYFERRAQLRFLQKNYIESVHDYQAAIQRSPTSRQLYRELAAVYATQQSDQLVTQTWEWIVQDIQRQLPGMRQRSTHGPLQRDSLRRLQEELGHSYLARGLYFIETRRQPTLGCPDLTRAGAAGVAEAAELQQQHCH